MKSLLFTPGPGNTTDSVRESLNCDIGTRTPEMIDLTRSVRYEIHSIANCSDDFTVIPLQGSGTFAVESMLTSMLLSDERCLILVNGPYGERIVNICKIHGLQYHSLYSDNLKPIDIEEVSNYLDNNSEISAIVVVHFETGIGVLNPLNELLILAEEKNVSVLSDCMSSFGLLKINFESPALRSIAASSNKILQGPPGVGFVIAKIHDLIRNNSPKTLCLDLKSQYLGFEKDGMWRFTPPVQVIAGLSCALSEYVKNGGQKSRFNHYYQISEIVKTGLSNIGIFPIIPEKYSAPLITTFVLPFEERIFSAEKLSSTLLSSNIVIYPSNIKGINSFRVGFIGDLKHHDAKILVENIEKITNIVREKINE